MADNSFRGEVTTQQIMVDEAETPVHRVFQVEVVRGARQGEIIELQGPRVTVGRDPSSDICMADQGLSRMHAAFVWRDRSWNISDLGSRNGTFVDGKRIDAEQRLVEGDRVTLGSTTFRFNVTETSSVASGPAHSRRDALTGLPDRAAHELRVREAFRHAESQGTSLALMLVNLDNFSKIANAKGRDVAAALLRDVAQAITSTLGPGCQAARHGSDEFAVLAPGMDDSRAQLMAQRLRAAIAVTEARGSGRATSTTASVGLALHRSERPYRNARELVTAATEALRASKRDGKNRVTFNREPPRNTPTIFPWAAETVVPEE